MDGMASRRLSSSDKIALAAAFGVAALTFLFGGPWSGFLCLGICVVFLFQWFKQTEPEIESVIPALDYSPAPSAALQTPKITLPNGITIEDYPTEVIDQGWSSTTLVPQAASLLSNLVINDHRMENTESALTSRRPVLVLVFSEIPQRQQEYIDGVMNIYGPDSELVMKNCSDYDAFVPTFRLAIGRYTVFSTPHQEIGPRAEARMVYGIADLKRNTSASIQYFGKLRSLLDEVFNQTDDCRNGDDYLRADIAIEYKDARGNSFASRMRLRHHPDMFGMPIIEPLTAPIQQASWRLDPTNSTTP